MHSFGDPDDLGDLGMVLKRIGIIKDSAGRAEFFRNPEPPVDISDQGFRADNGGLRRGPAGPDLQLPSFHEFTDIPFRRPGPVFMVKIVLFLENFQIILTGHHLAVKIELEFGVSVELLEKVVDQANQLQFKPFLDFVPFKIPVGMGKYVDV